MLKHVVSGSSDGVAVCFLHAAGIDSWMWTNILQYLPEVKAISIDLPGHGASRDIPWTSLQDSADRVCEVVEQTCPSGAHLAALSLGSYVGFHALASQPRKFESAVLSGIHAGGMPRKWLMRLLSFGMAPFAMKPTFARKTAATFGVQETDMEDFVRSAAKTRPSAFRKSTNDVVAFEMPMMAQDIEARTLFLAGSNEHELILESLTTFANAVPNGSKRVIDGGGHGWPGSMPDVFAQILRGHIADLR